MNSHWFNKYQPYFLSLFVILLGACSDAANQAGSSITVPNKTTVTLVAVELSPRNTKLALNTQIQLHATGIYSDNSKQDISKNVNWNSSEPAIADFSTSGTASNAFASPRRAYIDIGSIRSDATMPRYGR